MPWPSRYHTVRRWASDWRLSSASHAFGDRPRKSSDRTGRCKHSRAARPPRGRLVATREGDANTGTWNPPFEARRAVSALVLSRSQAEVGSVGLLGLDQDGDDFRVDLADLIFEISHDELHFGGR